LKVRRPYEERWIVASIVAAAGALGFGIMTTREPTVGGLLFGFACAAWGFGMRDARQKDHDAAELEQPRGASIRAYTKEVSR
jgi:hypothetical protein